MIVFLFFSLQVLLASSESASQLFECSLSSARTFAANPQTSFTLREIVEECKNELNANSIRIDKISDSGSVQEINLSWQENGQRKQLKYFFNVTGLARCEDEVRGTNQAFLVDLDRVLSGTINSYSYNTCSEKGDSAASINDKKVVARFGFRRSASNAPGRKCERACGSGEILRGERMPVIFNRNGSVTQGVFRATNNSRGKPTLTEQLLDVRCVRCPTDPDNFTHTQTRPDSNICFDENGCPEGQEFSLNASPRPKGGSKISKNENPEPARPVSGGARGACVEKCLSHQVRDNRGLCMDDPRRTCEAMTKIKSTLTAWKGRFNNASQRARIGNCDMNQMRNYATSWVNERTQEIDRAIATQCRGDMKSGLTTTSSFISFLRKNETTNNYLNGCLHSVESSPRQVDLTIFNIMSEVIGFVSPMYNPNTVR